MVKGDDNVADVRIRLRRLRAELDLTQKEFAKLINMSISTYRKKETGESPFTLKEAYLIAKIANKSIDEIFLRASDRKGHNI